MKWSVDFYENLLYFCSAKFNGNIMTAVQMRLNAELFGALQTISEDEGLMKKAVKSLKRIASQKQAQDENLMSMAQLEDLVRQGEKEISEGDVQPIAIDDLWK